jgi:hypothetical protein
LFGTKVDAEGGSLLRSSVGSGSVFCEDKAATCSMLTSSIIQPIRSDVSQQKRCMFLTFAGLSQCNESQRYKELEL